jgi:hypothetical protein
LDCVHRQEFEKQEDTTFRKLDVFPSSGVGEKMPTLLGPLEIANLSILDTERTRSLFHPPSDSSPETTVSLPIFLLCAHRAAP